MPIVRSVIVLYENSTHRSPSIVAENSKTGPKSAIDFASIPVDELWKYRESIDVVLKLRLRSNPTGQKRRSYPVVQPKYCNPGDPSETWTGRGKATALGSDAA